MHYDERDPMYDLMAAWDYRREAYGAPCPRHGELTWGGDCSQCNAEAEADDDAFEKHRAADPHCTCPDCIAFHFEGEGREKGDDDGVEYADPRDEREERRKGDW